MGALALVQNGDDVLANLGLGTAKYEDLMTRLGLLSGIYLSLSWFGLSLTLLRESFSRCTSRTRCRCLSFLDLASATPL